jgi:outer membrane protein assembly factor BamB
MRSLVNINYYSAHPSYGRAAGQGGLWLPRWAELLLAALLISLLGACSSKDIDPEDVQAKLPKFKSSLKIQKVWSKGVGDDTSDLRLALRPATDGSFIYGAAHDGKIIAVEAEKGTKVWKTKTKLPLAGGPGTNGKVVVAGSSNGDLVALDATTGAEMWRTSVTSEVLAVPAVGSDRVVVRTVNGKLAAYSNETGEQLWSVQHFMPKLSVRGTAAPVITRNLVISGFDSGRVSAFDLNDGGQVWDVLLELPSGRSEIERLGDVNSTVAIAGGDVYAVSYQGRLGAIAIESGQLLWSVEMSSYSGLAVDVNTIFVTDQHSELVALSRGSGRELWRKTELRNRDLSAPTVFGGSVVVGDYEGYLHWFDIATGELQARARAGSDPVTTQPLVLNENIYVMSDNGSMYAYRVKPKKKR